MKKQLLFVLIGMCLLQGCGKLHEWFDSDQDEMSGQSVRAVPPEDGNPPDQFPPTRKIYSSVGFYSRGFLWSRDEIVNTDLWTVRPSTLSRHANHVSIYVSDLMRQVARSYLKENPTAPLLTLWDMSFPMGGTVSGHVSHRNGLDLDVRYDYVGTVMTMPNINYDLLWSLVKTWVDTGKVKRMFVDSFVKRKLCKAHSGDEGATEYLRRLRPYPAHDDHIHIRLNCPAEDTKCVDQVEVPPGSGC